MYKYLTKTNVNAVKKQCKTWFEERSVISNTNFFLEFIKIIWVFGNFLNEKSIVLDVGLGSIIELLIGLN